MFVSAELTAWLDDPQRQVDAREAADEFMKRWTSRAGVRELQHDLRSLKIRTADSVLAAARRFMSRTDEFRDLLRDFSAAAADNPRSEEHTTELPSLMRISYCVLCLEKKQKFTS